MVNFQRAQSGFSLVELAIVLIIVGLLVGGVLKGVDLVDSARTNRVVMSITSIQNGWEVFKAEHRRLPGDDNGDGNISTPAETVHVWNDLASTNRVPGITACASCVSNSDGVQGVPFPSGHFRGAVIDAINLNSYGFWFRIRGTDMPNVTSSAVGQQQGGDVLPVHVIGQVDRRMDDGRSQYGYIQTVRQGTGCYGTHWNNGQPDYQTLDSTKLCKLYFGPTRQEGRL